MSWMNDYTIQETMDVIIYPCPNLKRLPSPSNVRGYRQTWYGHSFQPRRTNTLKGKLRISIVDMLVLNGLFFMKAMLCHIFHAVLFFKNTIWTVSLNLFNTRGDECILNPDSTIHEANMGPTWDLPAPGGPHVGPMNFAIREVSVGWRDIDKNVLKRRSFGACFIENGLTYPGFGGGATTVAAVTATATASHQKQKQQHDSYDHRQRPGCETANHYGDVIKGLLASQITSLTIACWNVYSSAYQRKHQSSASLALCGEFTGDRWIPRTKGQ